MRTASSVAPSGPEPGRWKKEFKKHLPHRLKMLGLAFVAFGMTMATAVRRSQDKQEVQRFKQQEAEAIAEIDAANAELNRIEEHVRNVAKENGFSDDITRDLVQAVRQN